MEGVGFGKKKEMRGNWEGWSRRETVVRICCMKEESIFNKKGKTLNLSPLRKRMVKYKIQLVTCIFDVSPPSWND